jgi:tetratricopeptide (TPR) repeat protein
MNAELTRKQMTRATMLAKIEDVLKRGRPEAPPAYTLILGAGASFGVVPTAKEMLGFPDAKTKKVHERSIPLWLARQLDPQGKFDGEPAKLECSKDFWRRFRADNTGHGRCGAIDIDEDGFPRTTSIAAAYQAVFDTACIGGLDTPERHRNYMREVTLSTGNGATQLNATHFYLASLLSLQKRSGDLGSSKLPLYTGRREFARTIFTTNFDPLLQTSLQLFQLLYYMTDRPEFLPADALQTDHHPATHLFYAHGSVHRPYMANTDEQIALLKKQNARDIAAYLGGHGVIVLGYSGWDDCLLEALNQTKTFSNNLYWLARGAGSISDEVAKFLGSHPNAYWVEIDDGGSVMAELHSRLCPGAPNTEMLYNPIHPLLSQLGCVNLSGILSGGPPKEKDAEKHSDTSDLPRDVETIRQQIIARLEDAQRLFTEPPIEGGKWEEFVRQADLSYANKDWAAALSNYDRLLHQFSNLPGEQRAMAYFRRGFCHGQLGDAAKAIADYTAVIEMRGAPLERVAQTLNNRGVCHGQAGDAVKAIADYTAVIEMRGAPPERVAQALYNRGICHGQAGDAAKEIADYTAVIELPGALPEQVADALFNRGVCHGQAGDANKAIADYTAVIELPGAPSELVAQALVNRGIRHGRAGDAAKEIADYTAVVELPGAPMEQVADALLNRGVCHDQAGDGAKQMADYTAVIQLPGAPMEQVDVARARIAALSKDAAK